MILISPYITSALLSFSWPLSAISLSVRRHTMMLCLMIVSVDEIRWYQSLEWARSSYWLLQQVIFSHSLIEDVALALLNHHDYHCSLIIVKLPRLRRASHSETHDTMWKIRHVELIVRSKVLSYLCIPQRWLQGSGCWMGSVVCCRRQASTVVSV